jgi:hypothetical protein
LISSTVVLTSATADACAFEVSAYSFAVADLHAACGQPRDAVAQAQRERRAEGFHVARGDDQVADFVCGEGAVARDADRLELRRGALGVAGRDFAEDLDEARDGRGDVPRQPQSDRKCHHGDDDRDGDDDEARFPINAA